MPTRHSPFAQSVVDTQSIWASLDVFSGRRTVGDAQLMYLQVVVRHTLRENLIRLRDGINRRIAWALPKRIIYWAAMKVAVHSTVGKYGNTIVPELGAMEAIKRFGDDHGL